MIPLLLLLLAQPPARRATALPAGIQLGTSVAPETVAVGDPLVIRLRVRAPVGSRIEFPLAPDSASQVELIDPRLVQRLGDSTVATEQLASYRAAAWDTGQRDLRLADAVVRTPDGVEHRLALGALTLHVRSVLPTDTSLRVPRPPRPIFAAAEPWWTRWLLVVLAVIALLLALLALWWWLRRRRRAPSATGDAYGLAEQEFARIEALRLLEAGERGRFVALVVGVLRGYLARRFAEAAPSLTSSELLHALRDSAEVPLPRLGAVLEEADLVKFARQAVSTDRARQIGREARAMVAETDAAWRREREAAEVAQREAADQSRRARADEIAAAKRRSRGRAA